MIKPSVVEPGMVYYMHYALENTHLYKKRVVNMIFNSIMFLFFSSIVIGFLYYSYKNRPSPEEREKIKQKTTQQLLEKVASLNNKYRMPISEMPSYKQNHSTLGSYTIQGTHLIPHTMEINENSDDNLITNLPPLKFM